MSVERAAPGCWLVLDIHDGGSTLVQALTEREDGSRQARALARDYASEKQAYHDGLRLDDPLPARRREDRQRAA